MKDILIVDDSALMRSVLRDIISSDGRFNVRDYCRDGLETLKFLERHKYDAIVLDINMPRMNGIELMEELNKRGMHEKIIVVSTDTADGAEVTIKALELGAFDFIQKPKNTVESRGADFKDRLLELLAVVTECESKSSSFSKVEKKVDHDFVRVVGKKKVGKGNTLVALCSSTGGPKALQHVIPFLPKNLDAPVLIVQHMPVGFTESLAQRLDQTSEITVTEAKENDILEKGHVYIARGGAHLRYEDTINGGRLYYSDEPPREGVKPAANYMYESLINCKNYDHIVCVVLTGMGMDGTKGIVNLAEKRDIHIIAQDEASCTVYGMPKAIAQTGLVNQVVALDNVAQEIIMNVGVR